MEVTEIAVFEVDLPIEAGSYDWAGGQSYETFNSTIVRLGTDSDLTGFGEVTTLGSSYLPAYPEGARTGIQKLAPTVLGTDPTQPAVLNSRLNNRLQGHPYAKSAIDVAGWDIMGKAVGRPVVELLGGRYNEPVTLYRAISQGTPESMAERVSNYREAGYGAFQLKIGEEPTVDAERIRACRSELELKQLLIADANTGLSRHEAVRLVRSVNDVDTYIEQPCATYEACRAVRKRTDHPFVLDEIMDGVQPILRGYADDAMDVVNLKITKVGGLTNARLIRDLCSTLGFGMIIEDSWGSEIATSAIAHLAQSTAPPARVAATDFHNYNDIRTADNAPPTTDGTMEAQLEPGLGIEPRMDVLGEPIAVYR